MRRCCRRRLTRLGGRQHRLPLPEGSVDDVLLSPLSLSRVTLGRTDSELGQRLRTRSISWVPMPAKIKNKNQNLKQLGTKCYNVSMTWSQLRPERSQQKNKHLND